MRNGLSSSELDLCAENGVAWVSVSGKTSNIFDLTHYRSLEGVAKIISTFKLSKAVRDMRKSYPSLRFV